MSTPTSPATSAAAASVLTALLSSVAAYLLGALVLPFLAAFLRRDRALKKLNLPTPRARNFAEKFFGTMARFDPTVSDNYMRTVMQKWAAECAHPPLLVSRGMDRHLVVVLDPGAATSVLSRASNQEKSTEAYFGLNLISDAKGRSTILSHETGSREWRWVRKAVAPAFSQAAMKSAFEGAIRSPAEAAAEALALVAAESGDGTGTVSVNVDDLAAATAMDVITSFGFGVRTNAVERLGARLAESERAKKSSPSSSPPIPVPEPLIPGAEHTVEAMHAATEAAELYVVEPWRAWKIFQLSGPVRRGSAAMARVRACIDAVLAAAEAKENGKSSDSKSGDGKSGDGGKSGDSKIVVESGNPEQNIFSRLKAVAPAVAALDRTDDAASCLRREAGLLYFAGIDTSSHTLAYTLALLAAHPRAAAKVEAELEAAGLSATGQRRDSPSPPRRLEFADLSRSALPYLHAVLMESMRLLPVAAGGTARTAGKGGFELTVPEWEEEEGGGGGGGGGGGEKKGDENNDDNDDDNKKRKTRVVRVPEGVDIWVPFYVLHRSRAVWGQDAEEFVPERFLDPSAPFAVGSSSSSSPSSDGGSSAGTSDDGATGEAARRFLPFSLGARDCVGQALARTALIAELATLLGRFSFAVDREKMGGSLLPTTARAAATATATAAAKGSEKGGQQKEAVFEGLGSTVIRNEAMAVTLRVLGGVWLLATPRGEKRGAEERES